MRTLFLREKKRSYGLRWLCVAVLFWTIQFISTMKQHTTSEQTKYYNLWYTVQRGFGFRCKSFPTMKECLEAGEKVDTGQWECLCENRTW